MTASKPASASRGPIPLAEDLEPRLMMSGGSVNFYDRTVTAGVLNGTSCVVTSPDGAYVYATGLYSDSLAVYRRNATSGQLTWVQQFWDNSGVNGLDGAVSVAISPDGKSAYVAGSADNGIAVFSRSRTSGKLTYRQFVHKSSTIKGLQQVTAVTVSPDGKGVYAVGLDGAVVAFRRDAATSKLTYAESERITSAAYRGVVVSPDSKTLYATDWGNSTVRVYTRSRSSSKLTLLQTLRDNSNGVNRLASPWAVAISPDGKNVYVSSHGENAINVFTRNTTSGKLSFARALEDGVGSTTALKRPTALAVSPDGRNVYAVAKDSDSLVVFTRSLSSGRLTFRQAERDNRNGVNGLDWPLSLTVSPDGKHVYTAAFRSTGPEIGGEDALAIFRRT